MAFSLEGSGVGGTTFKGNRGGTDENNESMITRKLELLRVWCKGNKIKGWEPEVKLEF